MTVSIGSCFILQVRNPKNNHLKTVFFVKFQEDSPYLLKAYIQLLPESWCSELHQKDMSNLICTSLVEADIGSVNIKYS